MERVNEFQRALVQLRRQSPEKVTAILEFIRRVEEKGVLDAKTKELIALAAGIVRHCEWCIAYHVKGARDAGASRDEILEAAWVAVMMDGTPGLAHLVPVLQALEDFVVE
jgi:AhpD family alkylhydroperoxidase